MAPPDLARDAPVLDVAHPFVIGLGPVFRDELDAPVFDGLDRPVGERCDLHVPLVGEKGFDHGAGAVAARDHEFVVLDLFEQTPRLRDRRRSACAPRIGRARGSGEPGSSMLRVDGEDVDLWQVVALADFVVVEIMRRRDLHAAGAEFLVDVLVGNDRNLSAGERQFHHFADEMLVALIVRMHRDGGVAEHGFRACGGDDQMFLRARDAGNGYATGDPASSSETTSRSETAVCSTGSQFTRRLPR